MPLPRGKFDQRVGFERATLVADEYGSEVPSWAEIALPGEVSGRWAALSYGRGDERREAAREGGVQPATFIVLADEVTATLTVTDRITFGGVWNITGIVPRGRAEIEITAVKAS